MSEDLTTHAKIQTVSSLMSSIEEEIEQAKAGTLKPEVARLAMRGRALQMKGVELYLAAARLEGGLRRDLVKRMGPVVEAKPEGT